LFRNQIISLGWKKDEEWRQIVQEAKAHLDLYRPGEGRKDDLLSKLVLTTIV
jgi:hypothetical protein